MILKTTAILVVLAAPASALLVYGALSTQGGFTPGPIDISWGKIKGNHTDCDDAYGWADFTIHIANFVHGAPASNGDIGVIFQEVDFTPNVQSCGSSALLYQVNDTYYERIKVKARTTAQDTLGTFAIGHDMYGTQFKRGHSKFIPFYEIDSNGIIRALPANQQLYDEIMDQGSWQTRKIWGGRKLVHPVLDATGNETKYGMRYWRFNGGVLHSGNFPNIDDLPDVNLPGFPAGEPGNWKNNYHGLMVDINSKYLFHTATCCDPPGVSWAISFTN